MLSGLPGTGKSSLAAAIAARHPVAIVRSDEVRKALFKQPAYTPGESGFVYLTCYALLQQLLTDGYSVIFDATNLRRDGRQRVRRLAAQAGAPTLVVHTVAPAEVVAERLARRAAGVVETYASDAGWEVHERMAAAAEPVSEPALEVDTSKDIGAPLAQIVAFLRRAAARTREAAGEGPAPPPDGSPREEGP
jgi:predicted kinase